MSIGSTYVPNVSIRLITFDKSGNRRGWVGGNLIWLQTSYDI